MDIPKTSGIYKIENTVNGKCYIGQAENLKRRIDAHIAALKHGYHFNNHLLRAWEKYGEHAFTFDVVEICDIQNLDDREMYYIDYYNSYIGGYNKSIGGSSNRGWHHSDESKRKMRENHADVNGSNNPMYGITLYDKLSPEQIIGWKKKISIANSGENNAFYGKKHTAETKAKISIANKKHVDSDNKIKTYKIKMHHDHGVTTPIVCLNTGEYFNSIVEACLKYGACSPAISACCSGLSKSAGTVNGEKAVYVYANDFKLLTQDEIDRRLSEAQSPHTGDNNKQSKAVICINTGIRYPSARDAANKLGLDFSTISKVCRGKNKSCGKDKQTGEPLIWMFYENYLMSYANHESEAC